MSERRFSLEALRVIVSDRVTRSSLRTVAAEVGVNHGSIHNFLNGTRPQRRVLRALDDWAARSDGSALESALSVLLAAFPEDEREAAAQRMRGVIAELHRSVGVEPPPWTGGE